MKAYTLKSVARRGSMLGAAFAIVAASIVPAATTYADALNPLTERSLSLSSSAPGWSNKDGSGNTTYAMPNSGANGEKTGNTFSFRVSSTETLKAMTFQYCTTPAGDCMGPGNIAVSGTRADNGSAAYALETSDLEIKMTGATEINESVYGSNFNAATGNANNAAAVPGATGAQGSYIVLHGGADGSTWSPVPGWTVTASERQTKDGEEGVVADGTSTGKANFIKLANADNDQPFAAGDYVKVVFFGTNNTYITNPGAGSFFVKINTYKDAASEAEAQLVDGGVTVANVMNLSIEIQTKVLETMDFSVGTVDPNTLDSTNGATSQLATATGYTSHSSCIPIANGMDKADKAKRNILQLGNSIGEFSLDTRVTYSTHSYWRLSSNSSAGATVYYSGVTLSNTVGDQIDAIGKTAAAPSKATEQFGLALDNGDATETETVGSSTRPKYAVSYAKERYDGTHMFQNGADNAVAGTHATYTTQTSGTGAHDKAKLAPLAPTAQYGGGTGIVNVDWDGGSAPAPTTSFAFDPDSNLIPTPLAQGTEVVDCVTGKVRYIANIAATTPAGIYTTKINYIASPKY